MAPPDLMSAYRTMLHWLPLFGLLALGLNAHAAPFTVGQLLANHDCVPLTFAKVRPEIASDRNGE